MVDLRNPTWMDLYLFTEWFVCEFEPKVKSRLMSLKLPVNALLVLANVFTHQDEVICDGETVLSVHLCISLQQPIDQGEIECFKRKYCQNLLSEVLYNLERNENTDLIQLLKIVNIKDEIFMVAKTSDEILPSTFVNLWRKVWLDVEDFISRRNPRKKRRIWQLCGGVQENESHRGNGSPTIGYNLH